MRKIDRFGIAVVINDNDLNFYWEEGNNEDATGADIFIYYDENWCSDSTYNVPLAFLPGAKFL